MSRRRRAVVLITALAVLAGALAYTMVRDRPAEYTATSLFNVSAGSASQLQIYVADFRVVMRSPEVLAALAEVTGESPERLSNRLDVERLENSSTVSVGYVAEDPELAAEVSRAATLAVLTEIEDRDRQQEVARVEQLQAAVDQAREPLEYLENLSGTLYVEQEYQSLASDIRNALVRQERARVVGDPVASLQAAAELSLLQRRQQDLSGIVEDYRPVRRNVEALEESLSDAERDLTLQDISLGRESVDARVAAGPVVRQGPGVEIVQVVLASALLAAALGAAVLLLPDLVSTARGGSSRSNRTASASASRHSRDAA